VCADSARGTGHLQFGDGERVDTLVVDRTVVNVIKVCKIFKDDLTLDNLSRPQLVGICRYMNLNAPCVRIPREALAICSSGTESESTPSW
jgi:hypothetical protein